MKHLPFILKHLRRNWIRSTSTVLAMALCIFLFCTLRTVVAAVSWGLESAKASRLVTRHAIGFTSMAGNLALLLNGIGLAVTFTILLVTANTMSMAVRERRTEIAVLKTLGFSGRLVMALILGEASALATLGGGLGLLLGWGMIQALPSIPFLGGAFGQLPSLGLSPQVAAVGFGLAVALGLLAGAVPAIGAYRARVTDMLRMV